MSDVKLIAGLGNPGKEYERTRHNVGFDVIDILSRELGVEIRQKKFNSLFGTAEYAGKKLILLKPQTYMNLSGQAVATVSGFYKLSKEDIMVVTDDMSLAPGTIRIRAKGSAGGHNGLSDIIKKIGGNDFPRLRIGIGKSTSPAWKNYVLGKPDKKDRVLIDAAYERSVKAVFCWIKNGIDRAMTNYNGSVDVEKLKLNAD